MAAPTAYRKYGLRATLERSISPITAAHWYGGIPILTAGFRIEIGGRRRRALVRSSKDGRWLWIDVECAISSSETPRRWFAALELKALGFAKISAAVAPLDGAGNELAVGGF